MISFLLIAAVLIGSIPTGWLIAKGKGINLREFGSGNIGATNVMRAMGKEAAILTLAGDMLKGVVPVVIAHQLLPAENGALIEGVVGIAAILGHDFSVFLKFRGGKGVATSLGVLLAYSPAVALLSATIWLLAFRWTGKSSLGALISFGCLPLSFYILDPASDKIIIGGILTILIFLRHIDNIRRLMDGTEGRIEVKKRVQGSDK